MSIQAIESAEYRRYNANTRDASVGDCVKRALTIAYSMDYDEVGKELNKIKRSIGASGYNLTSVYYRFCKARGNTFKPIAVNRDRYLPNIDPNAPIKVSDICDNIAEGTYLLEVSEKPGKYTTHLCAVVDGTLYDSWDSRDWYVDKWAIVTEGPTEFYDLECRDIMDDIDSYLVGYLTKLESKYSELEISFSLGNSQRWDRYTYEILFFLRFNQFPPNSSKYSRSKTWGHEITVKLNPRMSLEDNSQILKKKIAQKIYDWVYNVTKDVKDAIESEKFDWGNSKYGSRGRWYNEEKKLIMNLPEWCRSLISVVDINNNVNEWSGGYKYEVVMDALPDDPHIKDRGSDVSFYADTFRELKNQIQSYKEDYSRYNYEY